MSHRWGPVQAGNPGRAEDLEAGLEALAIFERLDARRDTARVLAAMHACGLRRGSRAAHRRALKGFSHAFAKLNVSSRVELAG